jgi:HD-GYP domain-containing protein (c-di-GMP phosphodiesterase class II)
MTQKKQSDLTQEVESLSRSLAETYEELNFIYRFNATMNVTVNPEEYFQNLAEDLLDLMSVKAILIVLSPEAIQTGRKDTTIIHAGQLPDIPEELVKLIEAEIAGKDPLGSRKSQFIRPDGVTQMLAVPIVRVSRQFGIIVALEPTGERIFNNIDLTRLSSVTNSVAMFLENFRLYAGMRDLFLGSLRALTSSIDAKDPYTCGHSERVAIFGRKIILAMDLPESEAERVYLCGLLHDIGKIGMPEALLGKPGKPTPQEFEIIKRHPTMGANIIVGIREMEDLVPGILHHHERFDGKGYPQGLAGEEIPLRARILGVADALDAMTSSRPYRNAMPVETAMNEVIKGRGTQFDPAAVEALLTLDIPRLINDSREIKGSRVSEILLTEALPA